MWTAIWDILTELAPWLLLGAYIAGLMHVVLPEGWIRRQLQGRAGVVKAVALGVPLPLCSCGVIPTAIGLHKDGASKSASMGFMVSTPQTGVDSILVASSFLGWPFALFKVAAALVTGILTGELVGWLDPEQPAPETEEALVADGPRDHWFKRLNEHALEIIGSIWGWLLVGVLISALLTAYVPAGSWAGSPWATGILASLVALAVSTPLYICATASVPIAAGLIHAGLPPSAALVFLMAGPATNVATMGAVRSAFGLKTLVIYLGTVTLGSLAAGALFDSLLTTTVAAPMAHHEHTGPVATIAAAVLLAIIAWNAFEDARAWLRARKPAPPTQLAMQVEGITCGGCARRLDAKLRELDGLDDVRIDVPTGIVQISGKVDEPSLRDQITAAGFTPRHLVEG